MQKYFGFIAVFLFSTILYSGAVKAEISAENATQLGRNLTPFGSEKAGNAAGTIPLGVAASPGPRLAINPATTIPTLLPTIKCYLKSTEPIWRSMLISLRKGTKLC